MKKAVINSNQCVACGVCTAKCPKNAISIFKGIKALVDETKCVGCSLCHKVCPANAVSIESSQNIKDEISS